MNFNTPLLQFGDIDLPIEAEILAAYAARLPKQAELLSNIACASLATTVFFLPHMDVYYFLEGANPESVARESAVKLLAPRLKVIAQLRNWSAKYELMAGELSFSIPAADLKTRVDFMSCVQRSIEFRFFRILETAIGQHQLTVPTLKPLTETNVKLSQAIQIWQHRYKSTPSFVREAMQKANELLAMDFREEAVIQAIFDLYTNIK